MNSVWCVVFFFFQAEDGIRDADVTGVQTCALPIYPRPSRRSLYHEHADLAFRFAYQLVTCRSPRARCYIERTNREPRMEQCTQGKYGWWFWDCTRCFPFMLRHSSFRTLLIKQSRKQARHTRRLPAFPTSWRI